MKKNYIFLLLLTVTSLFNAKTINAQINVQDSLALVDLYNSTDGPNWFYHDNWLTSKPVSQWWGVTVAGGRVELLYLYSNHLKGFMPPTLGNLTKLQGLLLHYNELSGSIPSELGKLTELQSLYLDHNQLSGSIPSELGNLAELRGLGLSSNQLSGSIPPELGKLTKLQNLDLPSNQLSGSIPPELGKLTNLHYRFDLSSNQLSGSIPPELGNLTELRSKLDFSYNQLSGSIPPELGNLTKLQALDFSYNQLRGNIPPELGNITNLRYNFNLSYNQLSGNIPPELGNLTILQGTLDLSYNKLKGSIPSQLGNLNRLNTLVLFHNHLTGNIPSSFSNLDLTTLNVSANRLSETVPSFLANMPNLIHLNIVYNHFTFDGIETLAQHNFKVFNYRNEKHVDIHQSGNTLSVYAGGTLSNNTYKWYNNGNVVATIAGDSTYTPTAGGNYSVAVNNSIATELTLYSDTIVVNSLSQNTAITASQLNKNEFSVYPNPAKTNATIVFNATGKYALTVTDFSGKILQTKTGISSIKKENFIQLDVSNYRPGIYFITINDEKNSKQTLKLIKE